MSIGPDDLPDPFGEGGLAQLFCACTSEDFHFILTDQGTVRAVCAKCGQVNREWRGALEADTKPYTLPPGVNPAVDAGIVKPPPLQVYAGMLDEGEAARLREQFQGTEGRLPKFSPSVANVYLDGPPAHGQILYLPPGCTEFWFGPACYGPTDDVLDGRAVWRLVKHV